MIGNLEIQDADLQSIEFIRRDDSVGFVIKGAVSKMPIKESKLTDSSGKLTVNRISYSLINTSSLLIEAKEDKQQSLLPENNDDLDLNKDDTGKKPTAKSTSKKKPAKKGK